MCPSSSRLDMNIVKVSLIDGARPVTLLGRPIVLLNRHLGAAHLGHPSDVTVTAAVALRDGAHLGRLVDLDAGGLGCVVPLVGVAPVLPLVAVVELDAVALVDAPRHETGALALVVVPAVDAAAAALVRVVVLHGAESAHGKLAGALLCRCFGISDNVAAVLGEAPARRVAGDGHIGALFVGELYVIFGSRAGATSDSLFVDGEGQSNCGGMRQSNSGDGSELHCGTIRESSR